MEKRIYNEKNGIRYNLQGNYYLPDLKLPDEENKPIGLWGQRHARHLKQNHKVLYMNFLTSGKLYSYLADIDKEAEEMFSRLVKQMEKRENVTEQLTADNQMEWVARMNNIRCRAMEIINTNLIYI